MRILLFLLNMVTRVCTRMTRYYVIPTQVILLRSQEPPTDTLRKISNMNYASWSIIQTIQGPVECRILVKKNG
jgi:hypothetical protein